MQPSNTFARWAPSSSAVVCDTGYTVPTETYTRITGLQLGVLSAEEIERLATRVISEHAVYARNLPKLDGPNDPALGPSDRRVRCATCRNTWFKCPGHFGVVRLPVPVYHVGFIDAVFKILQSFCWVCSKPLGDMTDPRLARAAASGRAIARFMLVVELGRGRFKCHKCSCPQPKYSRMAMCISTSWKPKNLELLDAMSPLLGAAARRPFTAADALEILRGIADEDVLRMGMDPVRAHPAFLIMQNLAVLPPNARPAIMAAEGSKRRGQDDATNQTQDVVKVCRALRRAIAKPGGAGSASANAAAARQYQALMAAAGAATTPAAAATAAATTAATAATAATTATVAATEAGGSRATVAVTAPRDAVLHTAQGMVMVVPAPAPPPPPPPSLAAAGTQRQKQPPPDPFAEFLVRSGAPSELSREEAAAIREWADPVAVPTITPMQAAAIWRAHPVLCEKLQNEVTVLFDNGGRAAPQARQRTGAPKRSIQARLTGKSGRVRGNNVAKRVDQNARSVIIPDAQLDVDELGVPDSFMNTLTTPEEVHAGNLQAMRDTVARGQGVPFGAARVLHACGDVTQLQLLPRDAVLRVAHALQPGDVVERHLVDGDIGCFNRQPSLHRLSFMVHRLRRVYGECFRVPLAAMTPYNADCDGDEMNLHILQSTAANAEATLLMAVGANLMNPQNNAPCMSPVQDTRVGAMLLTRRSTRLGLDAMHQCVAAIRYPVPGKPHCAGRQLPLPAGITAAGQPYWTGKQLVSLLLPSALYMERRVRGAGPDVGPDDPQERYVHIVAGELLAGTLCKATIGNAAGGIIHRIFTACGQQAVVAFISDLQRVVYAWLPRRGLSMGLRDCVVSKGLHAAIDAVTARTDAVVAELTQTASALARHMTPTEIARVEQQILSILTSVLDYASRLVLTDGTGSCGFRDMVTAASKGSTSNLAQVMACLGQQAVDGERIGPGPICARTLSMFPPGAFSAAARGFVAHAYVDGMQPHEYFFHMQGGREGLVATAVKTAETGYKYRCMAKAMETHDVKWDGSVRNAQGYIIEFIAGGDGMNPTRCERVDLAALLTAGDDRLRAAMGGTSVASNRVLYLRDALRSALLTPLYAELATRVLLPFNPRDELVRIGHELAAARSSGTGVRFAADVAPASDEELLAAVDTLVHRLLSVLPSPEAGLALEAAVRYECRPETLRRCGINVHTLRHVVAPEFTTRLARAQVQPGEAVGIVAGQSIGEPSTQFTLNAFHQAGLVQRRMTVGVPRLKELLHASKHIRTPSMLIPFKSTVGGVTLTPAARTRLAGSLQFLCIDSILKSSYPVLDPAGDGVTQPLTTLFKDDALLRHAALLYGSEIQAARGQELSPWIVRLVLHRAVLSEHGHTPESVARAIATQLSGAANAMVIVYSQPNAARWVLRLRLLGVVTEEATRKLHRELRASVLLGGIDGVRHARVINVPRSLVDPASGAVLPAVPVPVIDTDGSALLNVATRDWADWEHTITNDVAEVARTLGIVAARALLFAELDRVISYDGGYVDARHLRQVVATMTHRGYLLPLTRHGINRADLSVLQRASYEEPVEMLLQGAMTAERDPLRGVCECIMFGQKPPVGTGTVAVQQDVVAGAAPVRRTLVASRELTGLPGTRKRFREPVAAYQPLQPLARNATGCSGTLDAQRRLCGNQGPDRERSPSPPAGKRLRAEAGAGAGAVAAAAPAPASTSQRHHHPRQYYTRVPTRAVLCTDGTGLQCQRFEIVVADTGTGAVSAVTAPNKAPTPLPTPASTPLPAAAPRAVFMFRPSTPDEAMLEEATAHVSVIVPPSSLSLGPTRPGTGTGSGGGTGTAVTGTAKAHRQAGTASRKRKQPTATNKPSEE